MHISYIFITVEKTKSLYAYNGCLLQEIVRSSDVFIKHNFVFKVVYTLYKRRMRRKFKV